MKFPIVEVFWLDAFSMDGWHKKAHSKIRPVRTAGLLIKKTKDALVIALCHHHDRDEPFACTMTIPRRAVRKMRTIR